jgi:gas vesicle protein
MGRKVNDNISDGVVTGGILGGLAGLLIGAGSMVIPGLGIVAAAGPITGLLSGAVTGGIVGGLVDLGIPENRSRQYETDIKAGKILFSMRSDEDKVDRVGSILRSNGAISVDTY